MNYPATYSPYQTPVQYQAPQTPSLTTQPTVPTSNNSGIIWVQGEAGAKAYPVGAGNSVLLMDSEAECFYIKSTDTSGMPMPLRVFQYSEVVQTQPNNNTQSNNKEPQQIDTSEFVTRTEFEELKKALQDMKPITRKYERKEKAQDGE